MDVVAVVGRANKKQAGEEATWFKCSNSSRPTPGRVLPLCLDYLSRHRRPSLGSSTPLFCSESTLVRHSREAQRSSARPHIHPHISLSWLGCSAALKWASAQPHHLTLQCWAFDVIAWFLWCDWVRKTARVQGKTRASNWLQRCVAFLDQLAKKVNNKLSSRRREMDTK